MRHWILVAIQGAGANPERPEQGTEDEQENEQNAEEYVVEGKEK